MSRSQLFILVPVYNDWESLGQLLPEIDRELSSIDKKTSLLIVNDGSTVAPSFSREAMADFKAIEQIELVTLTCNIGHQRAIATGLSVIEKKSHVDAVIVMDADGEDRPEDIQRLLEAFTNNNEKIVVARRDKRTEGAFFKWSYFFYKKLFRVFTGQTIAFGNYCLIPAKFLRNLTYHDSLWNHLPASILHSRLPLQLLPTTRGKRYAGQPKMNLKALVLLGLSAVSVFSEVALLRTLAASLFMSVVTVLGMVIVMFQKFFTELAIPGWASDVFGSLLILFVQCLIVSIFILFLILSNRANRTFIPAKHCVDFISEVITLHDSRKQDSRNVSG